jgi:hypothetical protein
MPQTFNENRDLMKAFLIDPAIQSVTAVDLRSGLDEIRQLIGFDTVDSDEINAAGDRLFFDEQCFIRNEPHAGRFKFATEAPVAGRGVIACMVNGAFQDCSLTLAAIQQQLEFTPGG